MHIPSRNTIPSKEELESLYAEHTDHEIALLQGVSEATIRRWRGIHAIPSRSTGKRTPKKLCSDERLTQLVAENYSIAGVCAGV